MGDKDIWYMFVWGDDFPDVDLKCFILIHVYAMKWRGGNLFPCQQEVGAMPANGIYKTLIEEYDLHQTLKLWYKNVLRRLDKLLCHCCRKTAYLWDYIRCEHDVNKLWLQAGHDMPSSVPGARTVRASTIRVGSGKYHFQNWHVDSLKT
jgi:hypothetical protein